MKLLILSLALLLANSLTALGNSSATMADTEGGEVDSDAFLTDSLQLERKALTTWIYQNEKRVSRPQVIDLLRTNSKALSRYRLGGIIKVAAPLVALSGIALGYKGIVGKQVVTTVRGQRTPANPYPEDVPVEYTKRNLPYVLGGLGLFVGGMSLLELSNDLTSRAITLYNAHAGRPGTAGRIQSVRVCLNTGGDVALVLKF